MKILSSRLSKGLLLSVLALVLVGSVAAAFIWISNIRTTTVTVRPLPITLSGDFDASPRVSEQCVQSFNFTVNDELNKTGYVWIEFYAAGETLNPEDIQVSLNVEWETMYQPGTVISGYPVASPNRLTFLFGTGEIPFDFTTEGTSGTIPVNITYNVAYTIEASIKITSTLS